jgi:hypothetical protein
MPESPLARKLKIKPGTRAVIVNPPDGFLRELGQLPDGVEVSHRFQGSFDWVQIFVKDKAEFDALAPKAIQSLKPVSLLWICFPKGSSKIQTDLTRDKGWEGLRTADLKFITLVSLNEVWSAFSLRPFKPGEVHGRLPWFR